jgi:CTP:molybdopterin cytidylyltransferase MocA
VRRTAVAALEAGAIRVIVVLGANAGTIAPALVGLTLVDVVVNPEWESGLASSLVTGLSAFIADDSCDAVLVTLADQPLVDGAALRRLIAAFDDEHRIVAAAYDGTIGVPAVFGREHLDDLMRLTGDRGAGSWLRARQSEVTRVPLYSAAIDIDTPSDVARLS